MESDSTYRLRILREADQYATPSFLIEEVKRVSSVALAQSERTCKYHRPSMILAGSSFSSTPCVVLIGTHCEYNSHWSGSAQPNQAGAGTCMPAPTLAFGEQCWTVADEYFLGTARCRSTEVEYE